ncbi:hypothetical protein SO802_030465, partial [Lithocarpus litseifolius]
SFGDPFVDMGANTRLCFSVSNGTICCDRSSIHSDICVIKGDVRTHSASSSIFLYTSRDKNDFVNYGEREMSLKQWRSSGPEAYSSLEPTIWWTGPNIEAAS